MVYKFGAQTVDTDGSIVRLSVVGVFQRDEVEPFFAVLDEVIARYGCYATLIDAQAMRSLSAESRKFVADWKGVQHCYGNAIYGAGLAARTAITLVTRAIQLFTGKDLQVKFFDTQAEACTWITNRRQNQRTEADK